jgi:hypothetical protein
MTFQRLEFDGHPLRGLWGTSGDDVWLVPYDSPLQHWDGSAFSNLETLHLSALDTDGMLGSWGFSPDNIWAVGLEGTIVHYDGAGWERVPTPSDVTLWSIWGLAPDDIWVAGGRGTLLRWDGSNWREFSAGTVKEDER